MTWKTLRVSHIPLQKPSVFAHYHIPIFLCNQFVKVYADLVRKCMRLLTYILVAIIIFIVLLNEIFPLGGLKVTVSNKSDIPVDSFIIFHRGDKKKLDKIMPNEIRKIRIKFPGDDRIKISVGGNIKVLNVYIVSKYGRKLELTIKRSNAIEWKYKEKLGFFKKKTLVGVAVDEDK